MSDKTNKFVLVAIILVAVVLLPYLFDWACACDNSKKENFTALQQMQTQDTVSGVSDIPLNNQQEVKPRQSQNNYESLIYDNTTGTIMTGTQFMDNTGIIAPPWVAPAWNPDAVGPSSKSELDPADYENDPRMLYNKCSLSCCSPQYPTPFQGPSDPFVCDESGESKYLASDYICQNNTGGTGCLCMTNKQEAGFGNGFVDYYVDKKNLDF